MAPAAIWIAGRIWRLGLICAATLGAVSMVIMLRGQSLLRFFGLSEDLAREGGPVLWMYAYGIPAMLMYVATTSFLESIGRTLPGFAISVGANIINVILCWTFVFGKMGFQPMGAEGAAMALTITRGFHALGHRRLRPAHGRIACILASMRRCGASCTTSRS